MKDDCGSKITKLLSNYSKPVDAGTLVEKLKVNKTTVYRQIEKLVNNGVILEVEFGDGKKRYELRSLDHHHHLICNKCGKLEDIELDEQIVLNEVAKKSDFKVESHSLEFFGLCVDCK